MGRKKDQMTMWDGERNDGKTPLKRRGFSCEDSCEEVRNPPGGGTAVLGV